MKTRLLSLMTLLVLLAGLFPATGAFADDDGDYKFYGTVVSFPADWVGDWVVNDGFSNRAVYADAQTRIEEEHGPVTVSACVEVKASQLGNTVYATKIETKENYKCNGSGGGGHDHGYLKIYGTIEDPLPSTPGWVGAWLVSGWNVEVMNNTRIEEEHGQVAVGAFVEVKGTQTGDRSMTASKIEVKMGAGSGPGGGSYTKFYGTIEDLDMSSADPSQQCLPPLSFGETCDWLVSGRTVRIDSSTRFELEHGPVVKNACVEVKGWQGTGTVSATKIETKEPHECPGGRGRSVGGRYIKFYGTVRAPIPATDGELHGTWNPTYRVMVSVSTRIEHGPLFENAYVEVKGMLQADGTTVNATEVEVKHSHGGGPGGGSSIKLYGTIQSMPCVPPSECDWEVIDGFGIPHTVHVSSNTRIERENGHNLTVGSYIEVEGTQQAADGRIFANKIEVKRSGGTGGSVGYVKRYGNVTSLPGTSPPWYGEWLLDGSTRVLVDSNTRIEEEHNSVRIGALVEVKGIQQTDANGQILINATKIEVKQ